MGDCGCEQQRQRAREAIADGDLAATIRELVRGGQMMTAHGMAKIREALSAGVLRREQLNPTYLQALESSPVSRETTGTDGQLTE